MRSTGPLTRRRDEMPDRADQYDYHLPPRLIAQTPLEPRDASRLLVIHRSSGRLEHRNFHDIGDYLIPGDLLIANESRVIPARLYCRKVPTGGKVELLLLSKRGERQWEALVGGRKVHVGTELTIQGKNSRVGARVVSVLESGGRLIEFSTPVDSLLEEIGIVPLPPYIHEPLQDAERYQTIYARIQGSVAAPTAGLHFTPLLIERLRARGIEFDFMTLHIGLDTFRPVTEEYIQDHRIHTEHGELSRAVAERINHAKAEGRRVIAVGTTTVRLLETAARTPTSDTPEDKETAAETRALVKPFVGQTDLFIYPGFEFRVIDALITNFHLPRSTLLMLVAAFAGKKLMAHAYREAIERSYRFYSFGDASFII